MGYKYIVQNNINKKVFLTTQGKIQHIPDGHYTHYCLRPFKALKKYIGFKKSQYLVFSYRKNIFNYNIEYYIYIECYTY